MKPDNRAMLWAALALLALAPAAADTRAGAKTPFSPTLPRSAEERLGINGTTLPEEAAGKTAEVGDHSLLIENHVLIEVSFVLGVASIFLCTALAISSRSRPAESSSTSQPLLAGTGDVVPAPSRIDILRQLRASHVKKGKKKRRHHGAGTSKLEVLGAAAANVLLLGRERLGQIRDELGKDNAPMEVPTQEAAVQADSQPTPRAPVESTSYERQNSMPWLPTLYSKLFSAAAENSDNLREVVYCNLAGQSTSLFSTPSTTPRLPSPDPAGPGPGEACPTSQQAATDAEEAARKLRKLDRDRTVKMGWAERGEIGIGPQNGVDRACTVKFSWWQTDRQESEDIEEYV
eukprot:gb/GFBE01022034.1/.p1 GENE.gb/GFBE01022034.1/~~gb/GFBE01022034.1/.p1  ORF type:complete len:347 (+),score=63.64 gb/GFBE01022034.1/:1-1041(+)